jgi:hypothetical protein
MTAMGHEPTAQASEQVLESAVVTVLLQRHRAAANARTALDTVARATFVALSTTLAMTAEPTVAHIGAVLLVALVLASVWRVGRRNSILAELDLEETLSRMATERAEFLYARSRSYAESRVPRFQPLMAAEPQVWLLVVAAAAALTAVFGNTTA